MARSLLQRAVLGAAIGLAVGLAVVSALLPTRAIAAPEEGATDREQTVPRPDAGISATSPTALAKTPERRLSVKVTPEMVRLSNTQYALYFVSTFWSLGALWWLLRSGNSTRLRELAERKSGNLLLQSYVFVPLLALAYSALTLPLGFYASYVLPHQYGLSNQTLGGWITDGAKSFGITAVIAPPVVALLYWTLRRSPARWWLGFWLASIPLIVLSILLTPLVVEPLFYKFEALKNERLRERILALAASAGIERSRVFEADASRRTKAVNAYVTGIGGSARIVLWDTLLQRLDEDEIAFVMAHEMGHYSEKHVPVLVAVSILGTLGVLLLTDRGAKLLIRRHGERWNVRGIDDLASLPAVALLVLLINFLGSPVESSISRTLERRADSFGLRLTRDGEAAASAFVKLSEMNLSNPEPPAVIEWWMFSHPPLSQRIQSALAHRDGETQ